MQNKLRRSVFPSPVPPFPCWERRIYHLSRPITPDDIAAFLGNEELVIRENRESPVTIVHKYGLLEIHMIVGQRDIEVWFSPEETVWSAEYLDALLSTRF